jgi:hypothetical protein
MATTPAVSSWIRDRRRRLRAEIAVLEEELLDLGLTPAAPLPAPEAGEEAERLLNPFEEHAMALRTQLLTAGRVPPQPEIETRRAAAHAPDDWIEQLHDARLEVRAARARAEAAEADAEVFRGMALAALRGKPAGVAGAGLEQGPTDAVQPSTMEATRLAMQRIGPRTPVAAAQVIDEASRLLGAAANPATIRSNLVRLRDSDPPVLGHDERSSCWWLIDPAEPDWLPTRLVALPHR